MRRTSRIAGLVLLLGVTPIGADVERAETLKADRLPSFDAASITVNHLPAFLQPPKRRITPGRFTARYQTLKALTQFAFEMASDSQLLGGPDWFDTTRFDIDAVASGASSQHVRASLQRLLLERFSLTARSEIRPMPAYRLVRARGDGKVALRPGTCASVQNGAEKLPCEGMMTGPGMLRGYSYPMARFVASITELAAWTGVHRPVVDETGLVDSYDFTVEFTPATEPYGLFWSRRDDLPDFPAALKDQLGLSLLSATLPTRVMVIEKASLPTPN